MNQNYLLGFNSKKLMDVPLPPQTLAKWGPCWLLIAFFLSFGITLINDGLQIIDHLMIYLSFTSCCIRNSTYRMPIFGNQRYWIIFQLITADCFTTKLLRNISLKKPTLVHRNLGYPATATAAAAKVSWCT